MVRIIHVDQGAQTGASLDISEQCIVSLCDGQQWSREVGEQVVLSFNIQDVGVLGDRPERSIVAHLDPGHRSLLAQVCERLVKRLLIGVGLRSGQHVPGGVGDPVVGACAH